MLIFGPQEDPALDEAIDNLYREMQGVNADSREYAEMANQLGKLYALRQKTPRISPDTLLVVLGHLAGIIAILSYERTHVVTSKALGFVLKPR